MAAELGTGFTKLAGTSPHPERFMETVQKNIPFEGWNQRMNIFVMFAVDKQSDLVTT
jgi:hypothetical protein